MEVRLLAIRHIEVDDIVDFIDIDTPSHEVGGNQ